MKHEEGAALPEVGYRLPEALLGGSLGPPKRQGSSDQFANDYSSCFLQSSLAAPKMCKRKSSVIKKYFIFILYFIVNLPS